MNTKPSINLNDKEWDETFAAEPLDYLAALTGSDDPLNVKVHWQTFDDAFKLDDPRYRPYLARSVFGSYNDLKLQLRKANRGGAGIFVGVNETDGIKRSLKTIVSIRAVWAESDGTEIDIPALPLAPSIIVQSHHGPHLYWRVTEGVSSDECRATVKAIANHLKCDPKVHNPDRVLRVPGFFHLKIPDSPFPVRLVKADRTLYTIELIHLAFPPIAKREKEDQKNKSKSNEKPKEEQSGSDNRPENKIPLDDRIAQATAYVDHVPGAKEPGRHNEMFKVASILARGFELPDNAALPIFENYASRCEPPVPLCECPSFLDQARRYGTEPLGGRVREPLPTIEVTTNEKAVADRAVAALAKAGGLFHRGNRLVHIVTEGRPKSAILRPEGTPHISPVHVNHLRERISAAARFVKRIPNKKTTEAEPDPTILVPIHIPTWCPNAIHARESWPELPYLQGVVATPILREDGSIFDQPGYDSESGMFFAPQGSFPSIPKTPTEAEARGALNQLREVFEDFPFAQIIHEAANLAAVLTPFVRSAMNGPAPLFNYDANIRGAGKTLGSDAVGIIATGRPLARMAQAPNDEEEEKRLAGIAMEGDAIVLIDNITRPLGSGALDAILTSTRWKPRILGKTGNPEFEVKTTFLATSNNVQIIGDLARRTLHIRICSPTDHPEDRDDFHHSPLLPWVTKNHARLAVAALTVLRAYFVAGRPMKHISPWGSYEEWSQWVREPIVWLMGVDPMETREELETHADTEKVALTALVDGWNRIFGISRGHTVKELLEALRRDFKLEPGFREAICNLCPPKLGDSLPEVRALGNKFKMFRERPIGKWCFVPQKPTAEGLPWKLTLIEKFTDFTSFGSEQTGT